MKLFYAKTSPYVRKVRVAAAELSVDLELVETNAAAPESNYGAINPVHRVPALQLDTGRVLFDSPVICEYLDVTYGPRLLPASGEERWEVLTLQALGDGLMDAAVPRRGEQMRPAEQQSPERLALYIRSMTQILDHLEASTDRLAGVDLGTIAISCALHYVAFRHPGDDWSATRPRLAAWNSAFAARPSMENTRFPA